MIRSRPPKPILNPVYGAGARGVAGWLGLLWLWLAFLLPGLAVEGSVKLVRWFGLAWFPGDLPRGIELIEWSGTAATTGLCWFLAWRLSRRPVWRSVELVIVGLWVMAVLIPFAKLAGLWLSTELPLSVLLKVGRGTMITLTLVAGIWTAYLLRSRRVARTYKRRDAVLDMAGAFD